ncbi:hypothetical protein FC093_05805 [Ilyomonas limi]|uniref:Outer membrane lipoprotein-sorting protein n=1 Tax=Ilyomonas limi TaxID=2575867 RepID=A0A4U3L4Y6_9BACT|nr:hypothetical protein [Ilyomonas limi]TKK70261.1 hypothetical protein FC093_05805 [Ilyomonas limi]
MRFIFFLIFLFSSKLSFAQDTTVIKEINQLIGPEFYFDTSNNNFVDDFYIEQKGDQDNIIIIQAWRKDTGNADPIGKIFVLERRNDTLTVIDSSARYIRDGRGPQWAISNDTLNIEHSFHGGFFSLHYTFNQELKKYLLISIELHEVIMDEKYNNVPVRIRTAYYDINKRKLIITIQPVDDGSIKKKITIAKKSLPENFIPDLAHFIDPMSWANSDSSSNIYDKVF